MEMEGIEKKKSETVRRPCLTFRDQVNKRAPALRAPDASLLPKSPCRARRYLNGMYSFGLMESRYYDQAEKVAMEVSAPQPLVMLCGDAAGVSQSRAGPRVVVSVQL